MGNCWTIRCGCRVSDLSITLLFRQLTVEFGDCKFVIGPTTHVVHMTIKPQEIVDEEDAKIAKSGTRDRDGNEGSPRCRCVIL